MCDKLHIHIFEYTILINNVLFIVDYIRSCLLIAQLNDKAKIIALTKLVQKIKLTTMIKNQ